MIKTHFRTRVLTLTGIFLAIAVVINSFSPPDINVSGVPALRLSFGGPFLKLPALLFGPAIGAIAGVLNDAIMVMIRGQGYLWPFGLVELLKGFSIGFLYLKLKKINIKVSSMYYRMFFALMIFFGVFMYIFTYLSTDGSMGEFISAFGKRSPWLIFAGILGLLLHEGVNYYFVKKRNETAMLENYLVLLIAVGIPCLFFTLVNTYILKYYNHLPDKAFYILLIPRFIEEIFVIVYNVYVLCILMRFKKMIVT